MKKLIISLLFFLLLSCGNLKQSLQEPKTPDKIWFSFNKTFTIEQVDSLIKADTLANIDEWIHMIYLGENNETIIEQYIFIRQIDSLETTYILTKEKSDSLYKAIKKTGR